jgi:diguanylate cyclase (GGDEF)-like protein
VTALRTRSWLPLFAKLFAGGVLLLTLSCVAAFEERRDAILLRQENEEIAIVAAQIAAINDTLHRVRADLYILSRQSEIDHLPEAEHLADLAREYADFERAAGVFENIRLFDARGVLLIDVHNEDGDVRYRLAHGHASPADLDDLRALSAMSSGGLLMSRPLVQTPSPRPLLRFGIAIPGRGPAARKVLTVLFRADILLDRLAQLAERTDNSFILVDRNGYWISRADASYTWGFDRHEGAETPLVRAYPEAWAEIAATEGGTLRSRNGVFVFRTAHPAIKGFWGVEGDAPPSPEINDWKVISFISPEAIARIERDILETLVPFFLASLIALGLASWAVAATWTERQSRHHHLLLRATTDPLTGALNRAAFDERLEQALSRYRETGEGCALIFVDLDDFKAINDTFGHDAGDACLRETVACIRACIRDSDLIGRLGGDEFAVILSPCKSRTAAAAVAAKITLRLDALPAPFVGATDPIRASLGIALCPADGKTAEMLLHSADQAMYGAKRDRRDRRSS